MGPKRLSRSGVWQGRNLLGRKTSTDVCIIAGKNIDVEQGPRETSRLEFQNQDEAQRKKIYANILFTPPNSQGYIAPGCMR